MTTESHDLERLVREVDPAARERLLADLFRRHRERLRAAVKLRLSPRIRARVDSSDVLQETYMEASRKLGAYLSDPRLTPYLWLRRMAIQALYDVHRHHFGAQARSPQRERHGGLAHGVEATSERMALHMARGQTSPSAAVERKERTQAIQSALERLPASDRELIALRIVEGLSNAEAAQVLGVAVETAKKRYVRALMRFKEAYAGG